MNQTLKLALTSLQFWDDGMRVHPEAKEKMQEVVDIWRELFRAEDYKECIEVMGKVASPVYIEFFKVLDASTPKPKNRFPSK